MNERFTQTVDIETPELVVVSYTIAGIGSRAYAAMIDTLICIALFIALLFGIFWLSGDDVSGPTPSMAWAFAFIFIIQFVLLWGYYLLFEALRDGQTPGKRWLGLRAVRDGGHSLDFASAAVRNLMRIVDMQPGITYLVGLSGVAFTKNGKRLGDIVAGTLVVRETLVAQPAQPPAPRSDVVSSVPHVALLTDDEYQLVLRWSERRSTLEPERRRQLTTQVATRVRHALGNTEHESESGALLRLLENEREARRLGAAAHGATGASRERYAIVTTSSPRWIAFAGRLTEVQRRGLRTLGEDGVRDFVAEYRALSIDLARLRTAAHGEASSELFYLGRLVAGAHNVLYRERRTTWRRMLEFIAIDVPTEVRRSWRPIVAAAAFLFVPAIIAATGVIRDPSLAETFIPRHMLDRAEQGVERAKSQDGYIPDPQIFRPVMASRIMANNIQVTFAVFAFGITAGIGTLLLLLLNGVSLGGVVGLYASKGILGLLIAFVAPHGVLELSAVCIAGGAGLLIAASLVLPGARSRRQAFTENSRRAMKLLAASTVFLIVAGSLEGMVSPIPYWPLDLKLIISATTLVLMIAYLRGGARPVTVAIRADDTTTPADLLSLQHETPTEGRAL